MTTKSHRRVSMPSTTTSTTSRSNGSTQITSPSSKGDTKASFTWGNYLKMTDSHAAPVGYFRHAPMNELWMQLGPGMKIEVINTDCVPNSMESKEQIFWFATVIRIEGYLALLRYEGYDDDSSMDFWFNLCHSDVHCVGWCGQFNVKLVPPRTIEHRQTDWKTFLVNRLVGSKTLPDSFHQKIQASLRCPFKKNMLVEVIDKHRVANMRIGKITDVVGGRLTITYEEDPDAQFSVHHTSNLIHPLGWSARVGHEIETNKEYQQEISRIIKTDSYPTHVASPNLFKQLHASHDGEQFKEGQKLEAVDPLDMSRICPATVAKVLKDGYFMLSIDGTGVEDGSDWFCYHSSSRLIFPIHFCKLNQIPLSPPMDYQGEFEWEKYLRETNSVFAPRELFQVVKEKMSNPFSAGMKLEAVDMMAPQLVCVATVAQVVDSLLRVHFDGWNEDFEQWIDCHSANIYPIGWCEFVGHKLEPPKEADQDTSETNKSRSKKPANRKSNKRKRISH